MRILVIGGTQFVGRHIVAAAVSAGHRVTVLHRGVGCSGAPHAEHLHADRDGDLGVLAGRQWDATIDVCAYWPAQVHHLADALGERGGHHVLISTVSVYADPPEPGLDERAPLTHVLGLDGDRPPVDASTYGPLKVGCEQAAERRHGAGLLVVRPTIVYGPHDPTGRFPYWVRRLARGGVVLAPGRPDAPTQYIDARDLAAFVIAQVDAGADGPVHVMHPEPPYALADMLEGAARAVAPEATRLEWVPSDWLAARGVRPRDLPLWTGSDDPEFALAMDPGFARSEGLRARPLADTATDTLEWLQGPNGPAQPGAGLTAEREAELLSEWLGR
jgi:2'-hydroxyisoflavone reductase